MADYATHAKRRTRIATVCYDQVVQPIYQSAQYRWKCYRDQIGASLDSYSSNRLAMAEADLP